MQDFYQEFKILFDLKLKSFVKFIDKNINAGNYYNLYGSFDQVREYFESNGYKFSTKKTQTDEIRRIVSNDDEKNIFDWNNESILNDFKKITKDFKKLKIADFHIEKFFQYHFGDIEKEIMLFKGYEDFYEVKESYGIRVRKEFHYIQNSLRTLKSNKRLLEILRIEFFRTGLNIKPKKTNLRLTKSKKSKEKDLSHFKLPKKLNWKREQIELTSLLEDLINLEFIASVPNLDIFLKNHFMGVEFSKEHRDTNKKQKNLIYKKFVWMGYKKDFIFLIDELINADTIASDSKINILLSNHFKWVDEDMIPNKLATLRNKLKDSLKKSEASRNKLLDCSNPIYGSKEINEIYSRFKMRKK